MHFVNTYTRKSMEHIRIVPDGWRRNWRTRAVFWWEWGIIKTPLCFHFCSSCQLVPLSLWLLKIVLDLSPVMDSHRAKRKRGRAASLPFARLRCGSAEHAHSSSLGGGGGCPVCSQASWEKVIPCNRVPGSVQRRKAENLLRASFALSWMSKDSNMYVLLF